MSQVKNLTIIAESILEKQLTEEIEKAGAHGYTITEARGKGHRGLRNAGWDNTANIRIEILCDDDTCDEILKILQAEFFKDYAMICFSSDVTVLRDGKFNH